MKFLASSQNPDFNLASITVSAEYSTNLLENPALSFFAKWEGIVKAGKCLVISWKLWAVLPQDILNCPFLVHCLCYYLCSNLRPQDCILFLTGGCTSFTVLPPHCNQIYFLKQNIRPVPSPDYKPFTNFLWTMMWKTKVLAFATICNKNHTCGGYLFVCFTSSTSIILFHDKTSYLVIMAQQSCYWTT